MTESFEEKNGITPTYIKEYFKYDDGRLIRIKGIKGSYCKLFHWEWSISGCGRRHLRINRKDYLIHRLIWIYHNGFIPVGMEVDHINRDGLDNRIENLRVVSGAENRANRSDNKSGYVGVDWDKKLKKWRAQIQIKGKKFYLGVHENIEDAILARNMAEEEYAFEIGGEKYEIAS